MNLLDVLASANGEPLRAVTAKVTAVASRKVTLSVQGSTVAGIPVADSYLLPRVNDVAVVLKIGDAWVAVSSLGQAAGEGLTVVPGTFGPLATLKGTSPGVGVWNSVRLHFESGWGSGAHATIGSTPGAYGPGIMLANPHVPWRDAGAAVDRGAFVRYATDSSGSVTWDAGTKGDVFRIARNGAIAFDVFNNGNVAAQGGTIHLGANGPCIRNESDVQYVFLWDNVRWMQLLALGFTSQSSARLKRDISDLPIGLPTLRALKPRRYRMTMAGDDDRLRDGLIAEELFEVYPEAVTLDADGHPQGIDYGSLAPVIIRAVQQLDTLHLGTRQRVADLEKSTPPRFAAAEARLTEVETRLAAAEARADAAETKAADLETRLAALEARVDAMTTPPTTP